MPKTTEPLEQKPFIVTNTPLVLVLVSILLIGIFGSLWWSRVHDAPRRVFAAMLENNLSVNSVTRSTTGGENGMERVEQLSFVPPIATRTYIKLTQPSDQGNTSVQTETIGTQQSDYSKYLAINVGSNPQENKKYQSIINIWGKTSAIDRQPQYLAQSLQGLVPFANLSPAERQRIIDRINRKQVYRVNYASTKPKRINGKSAIDFAVSVKPYEYVNMIKELTKAMGLDSFKNLDAGQYKDQPDVSINIVVDKLSRQILEVRYGQQTESYSAYGISAPIQVPSKTIPFTELQQKIQSAQ